MFEVNVDETGFMAQVNTPSEVKFWIENEIGYYENISLEAEEWCKTAKHGDIYHSKEDIVVVTVLS